MDTKKYLDNRGLEDGIRAAMDSREEPGTELNQQLIRDLRLKESVMKQQVQQRKISLWYVPMLLNTVVFLMIAGGACLVMAQGVLRTLVIGLCMYTILAGVGLTILGTHFANFKEELVIYTSHGKEGGLSL